MSQQAHPGGRYIDQFIRCLILAAAIAGSGCSGTCKQSGRPPRQLALTVVLVDASNQPIDAATFSWQGTDITALDYCGGADMKCGRWRLDFRKPGAQELTVRSPGFVTRTFSFDSGVVDTCGVLEPVVTSLEVTVAMSSR